MIVWYDGDEIGIKFSRRPKVFMQYPTPDMEKAEKQKIKQKPFINLADLEVELIDYELMKKYTFKIPKGYTWDGASIPRAFWRLIGAPTSPEFLIPSLIHDILCEQHNYVDNDRYFADKVFERLLYVAEVPAFYRWLMFHSVDNFQKFCKWEEK